jgi:hypothetical protein
MNEEEMKAARAKFLAALKSDNAGVVPFANSAKAWAFDVRAAGAIDGLRAALDGAPTDIRDAVIAAATDDKDDGVVAGFTYSDATVDSYGDTISPDGWKLDDYKRNPVVLFAHDQWSPPVGQDIGVHIVPGKALKGIVRFTPASTYEFGAMIGRMVLGDFLRATSVGFAPLKFAFNEERKGMWGMPGVDYTEQILRENSVVPVPANPNALADPRAMKAAGIDTRPLVEWASKQLDGEGALVLPRHVLESIARTGVPARVTVTAKGDDVETAELSTNVAMAAEDDATSETKKATGDGKCPACGHTAPMSSFEPAPEPSADDVKAAEALPVKALMAALKSKGVAVVLDSESPPRKDVAADLAERVAKAAAAETKRQIMERTGRLP